MATPSKLLLDTHVFLWWRVNSKRLLAEAREAIAAAEIVFVSTASAWEAAIKMSLGRLELPEPFEKGVVDSGFEKLLVDFPHASQVIQLPPHHKDPFDRMLIAQAQTERLTVVTQDPAFEDYEVEVLWT